MAKLSIEKLEKLVKMGDLLPASAIEKFKEQLAEAKAEAKKDVPVQKKKITPKPAVKADAPKNEDEAEITIDGYSYYLKKGGDSTHFSMSNTKGAYHSVSHIGQHAGSPYVDDVRSWLKGGKTPDGNKYGKEKKADAPVVKKKKRIVPKFKKDFKFHEGDIVKAVGLHKVVNGKPNPVYDAVGKVKHVEKDDVDVVFNTPKFMGSMGFLPINLELITKAKDVKPAGTKKYQFGDKWSSDFDYEGMLDKVKDIRNVKFEDKKKLIISLTDVNYHSLAKAIDRLMKRGAMTYGSDGKRIIKDDESKPYQFFYDEIQKELNLVSEDEAEDLFENVDSLPKKIQDILAEFSESDATYESCGELVSLLEQNGYTCEYGLDAEPYGLRKMSELEKQVKEIPAKKKVTKKEVPAPAEKVDKVDKSADDKLTECKKALEDAKYKVTKKTTPTGEKIVRAVRQDKTILKSKMDSVFKTIEKDVPKENLAVIKTLNVIAEKLKTIIQSIDKLVQNNELDKLEKIEALLKTL
jgi:hypothetical protein